MRKGGPQMKGLVFLGDRKAEVRDFPEPEAGPGEVVVRMKASGLCGTDLHLYRQTAAERPDVDRIVGHEPSGIVESVGHGVSTVRVGERVSVYHYRGCGHCTQCLGGNIMWCPDRRGYGGPIGGSHADFILTDARNCLPLSDELSFADGAIMACGAGTAFSAMRKLQVSGEDTVVVFGQGPVGLCGLLIAWAMGARVIAVEPVSERRALSRELGAEEAINPDEADVAAAVRDLTGGEGAALAFETSGNPAARRGAAECLRLGGKAAFVGLGSVGRGQDSLQIPAGQLISRQLTLMGSFVMPIHIYRSLTDLIIRRQVPLTKMITHRFPIEDAPEALELFDTGRTGKVIFEWE